MEEQQETAGKRVPVSSEKLKALQAAMDKIEKSYGRGAIMKLGDDSVEEVAVIPWFHRFECGVGSRRLSERPCHRDLWTGVVR